MDSPIENNLSMAFRVHGDSTNKYPAKSHARRVADRLGATSGLIVLKATKAELWPDSDFPRPFRQARYFFYLSGCNEPDTQVTYDIGNDVLTLWLPEIDESRVVWTGRGSTVEEALEKYDIDDARYLHGGNDSTTYLTATLGIDSRLAYTLPQDVSCATERNLALQDAMDTCRVIKDDYEIALIRRANEITGKAHTAVMRQLHKFSSEAEVEAAYVAVCIASHAREQAYAPIAGAGANASVLHYSENAARFPKGQTLVLDAGCEVSCYASDVTRTMPLNRQNPGSWPSKEAEDIYKLVEKVQERCIRCLGPDVDFNQVVKASITGLTDGLLELGILKGKREAILRLQTYRAFYPHGLGHHLGLECHDVSPRSRSSALVNDPKTSRRRGAVPAPIEPWLLSNPSPLKPGMVITIEPGLYFNQFLIETMYLNDPKHKEHIDVETMRRYMDKVGGVRIEDDILITKSGFENLTTAPKGAQMFEVIRHGANRSL